MKYVIALVLLASQLAFAGLPPTTSKGAGDSAFKTTFNYDFGSILLSHSGTTVTIGTIPASMLAVAASAPLTLTNGTFGIPVATSGANGYLSSGDWSTFNSKLPLSYLGTVSVDIKPLSDTTYSIGSTSFNWASIWAQVFRFGSASINFGNGQVVDATGNQTFNFTTRILQEDSSNPMLGWGTLGVINMYTNKIINVGTPSVDTDAATKGYVDGLPAVFTANSPLVYSNGTLSIPAATTGVNGYLTSTDWNTFNNKQATISVTVPVLLSGTTISLGTVGVANGGIGLTSAIATGNFLMSNGSAYSAGSIAVGSNLLLSNSGNVFTISHGTTSVAQGGTGLSSIVTAGNFLMNVGGAYTSGTIAAGTNVTVNTVAGTITIAATPGASSAPTYQVLTSGTGATYTRPTSPTPTWLRIKMVGGGGSGASLSDTSGTAVAGSTGVASSFNSITAAGGGGAPSGNVGTAGGGGIGGTGGTGTCQVRIPGMPGGGSGASSGGINNYGGSSQLGPGAKAAFPFINKNVFSATANTGGGGSGLNQGNNWYGGGGGGGEYCELIISSPSSSYTYTVGTGGGGTVSTQGTSGAGGSGVIIVEEYY